MVQTIIDLRGCSNGLANAAVVGALGCNANIKHKVLQVNTIKPFKIEMHRLQNKKLHN
jgi:hypothetical protein